MSENEPSVLLLASGNAHKCEEMSRMLAAAGVTSTVRSLADFPGVPEAVEDGDTFEENARKKALHYAAHTGLRCVADDSGLSVDALSGRPGVHSARYAGPDADDAANRRKLLRELDGVAESERGAAFVCALVLAEPGEVLFETRGETRGRITETEHGAGGFGYDPLFRSDDLKCTFAECEPAQKDRVSHRGRAFSILADELRTGARRTASS